MRDGLINNVGLLVSGLVSLVLVPILLAGLGGQAYGLWISAQVLDGILGSLDFGLGPTVTKEVAGSISTGLSEATIRLVRSAATAQLLLGAASGSVLVLFALPLGLGLKLPPNVQTLTLPVFILAGVGFLGARMSSFAGDLLAGLRRFDLANLVVSFGAVVRACGMVLLLEAGYGLLAVAGWYAAAAFASAFFGFALVARLEPRLRFGLSSAIWKGLAPHARFGFGSQMVTAFSNLAWSGPPLLVGLMAGSSAEALYYVAQKFPIALSGIGSRVAGALFPAASEHERTGNLAGTRDILEVGTRWVAVVVFPIAIVLAIIAPVLLKSWVGHAEPETVLVFRLTAGAVAFDAVGQGALNLLWGRGAMRAVLKFEAVVAATVIGLTVVLLKRFGMPGAAVALVAAAAVGMAVVLYEAARVSNVRVAGPLVRAMDGLFIPGLACALATAAVRGIPLGNGWTRVLAASSAGGAVFLGVLWLAGSRAEERRLFEETLGAAGALVGRSFRAAGRVLGTGS